MGAFQFDFERDVPLPAAEMSLHLAMFAVEGLVGQARVRLGVSYVLDVEDHTIIIHGDTDEAKLVARVFAGLLLREFGERAFAMSEHHEFSDHELRAVPA